MQPVALVAAEAAPVAILVASAAVEAWHRHGSIQARYWLPHAAVAGLLLVALLVSGGAVRPRPAALVTLAGLLGLSAWTALSLTWSPVPSLARDEALLTAFFAVAFAAGVVAIRTKRGRVAALVVLVAVCAGVAVVTGAKLALAENPSAFYESHRLEFPIGYANAQAAFWLLAFWPAIALAARRSLPILLRGLALGGATALLAGWLLTQSKGGIVALALSACAFFLVTPGRVRSLVPALVAAGAVAAAYWPLTGPYRADDADEAAAIHLAGRTLVALAAAAALAGLLLALVDRRFSFSHRARRLAGAVALAATAASVAALAGVFFASVSSPVGYAKDRWEDVTTSEDQVGSSSHLTALGSERYDYWRVALAQFAEHPVAGIGGGGFGPAYLEHGQSEQTPIRAHSFALDTLSETGIVGFILLAVSIGTPLAALARGALRDPISAAVLVVGIYFVAHASIDVIWTFPAVSVPFFLLLAIGLAGTERPLLRKRETAPAVVAALALVTLAFAPPWLSAQFTERGRIDAARRLDPLSVEPLLAQWAAARSLTDRVRPLREAIEIESRSSRLYYLIGLAYLEAGREKPARAALVEARRLNPDAPEIEEAFELLRERGRG